MGNQLRFHKKQLPLHMVRRTMAALPAFCLAVMLLGGAGDAKTANQLCDDADEAAGVGKYDEAINLYNKSIKADEKLTRAYLNRGIALDQMNKFEEALKDFDKALSLCPAKDKYRQEFYYNRGMCLHRLNRFKDAIKDYDEALKLHQDASYNFMRGRSYRALTNFDKAISDFDTAAAHTEGDERASSLFHRGLTYRDMGKTDKALSDFSASIMAFELGYDGKDAMQLKGSKHNLPAAYFERGNLYKKIGKKELASADLKKADEFKYRPDSEHRLPVKIEK